jgi:mannosyltransferase OCH1-like enzyme
MSKDFPKIIWQTHNYKIEELPDHFKMVSANWINLNPGWEYKYVDHIEREEFLKNYPELLQYYLSLSPIFQSDVWRYLVTYENGGVYADMDSICVMPLDYMLDNISGDPELIVISKKENHGDTNNANYAVKKKSKIMKTIIEKLYKKNNEQSDFHEWHTWRVFTSTVYDSEDISYSFNSASHSRDYKFGFPKQLELNYYGEKINYWEFLEKNDLKDKYW